MSKAEVAKLAKLLADWEKAKRLGLDTEYALREQVLDFLSMYRHPLISALEFAAR